MKNITEIRTNRIVELAKNVEFSVSISIFINTLYKNY